MLAFCGEDTVAVVSIDRPSTVDINILIADVRFCSKILQVNGRPWLVHSKDSEVIQLGTTDVQKLCEFRVIRPCPG